MPTSEIRLNRLRRDDIGASIRVPDLEKVIGMRNVIAHEDGEIDDEIVWRAATRSSPVLLPVLEELLTEAKRVTGCFVGLASA